MSEPAWDRDFYGDYDMGAEELNTEQYDEILDDLVRNCPVARSEVGEGYWVVNRYADVLKAAGDWRTFTSRTGMMPNRPADMPLWYPIEADPPLHDELRKVLDPFLTPKVLAEFEPAIRKIAHELIDSFIEDGEVELVSQFANLQPGQVFCSVVAGMPAEDMPYLQERFQAGIIGPLELRGVAMTDALNYMTKYIEKRAEEPPRGDVVDAILAFEWDGEPGYEFIDRAGSLAALTQGGIGTTGMIFAGAMFTWPSTRRIGADWSRTRPCSRWRSRSSCASTPRRRSSAGVRPRTPKLPARRSPRARCWSFPPAPPVVIPPSARTRCTSTSSARRTGISRSVRASTGAPACIWRA